MTESETHRFIKNKIALALEEVGFDVKLERKSEANNEGIIDIYASKQNGELIKVEVIKSHLPNWLLVKVDGSIVKQVKYRSLKLHKRTYNAIIAEAKYYGETMDQIISRLLSELDECRKMKSRK